MASAPAAGRFARALRASKSACDLLAGVVQALYSSADELVELKADDSAFTIADGLVQHFLANHLFLGGQHFAAIVGEEDTTSVNLSVRPYTVGSLAVPEELQDRIDATRKGIDALAAELAPAQGASSAFADCTIFIDPIDGTREFSTKQGSQCTILVGFAVGERPVAGLVYRPVAATPSWASGCKAEGLAEGQLDLEGTLSTTSSPPNRLGLLTSNGAISSFSEAFLEELAADAPPELRGTLRVRAGGVGNKLLSMVEGKGECYIQDRGVSRWDTCAAQAVIEARGGVLAKLAPFIATKSIESYRYAKTARNLDFDERIPVQITKHNCASEGAAAVVGAFAAGPLDLKPYANVHGLLALDAKAVLQVDRYFAICARAAAKAPPTYS